MVKDKVAEKTLVRTGRRRSFLGLLVQNTKKSPQSLNVCEKEL